ncbi:hypothetical protein MMC30_002309 [Trapelia coarctata]|nr:hypothetical protein [Trapelia coarctata]
MASSGSGGGDRRSWPGQGSGGLGTRGRGRATGAWRSRSDWRGNARGGRSEPKGEQLEKRPIGHLIGTIRLSEVQSAVQLKDAAPTIEDCQYVASYNWLNRKNPTILVPGAPPLWTPPNVPPSLQQDSGSYFRDPNAARWPKFPMEPAIRAVFALRPTFLATEIDVVGCGNTMGNILRFLESSERSFVFGIEIVGGTAFLIRMGNSPTELIPDVWGYGHTYPEAYTSWDKGLKDSVSHQRIVRYRIGGLRCLLRFESDGYIKEKASSGDDRSKTQVKLSKQSKEAEMSALLLEAESMFVSERAPSKGANLNVELAGKEVPQGAIFDLKTRSAWKEINMEEIHPRLWLSQIPNFIVAYHRSGKFDEPQRQDLQGELKDWETTNHQLVRQFCVVLHRLIDMAKKSKGQRIEVHRNGFGPLEIRGITSSSWSALPHDLKAKWTGQAPMDRDSDEDTDADEDEDDYLNF